MTLSDEQLYLREKKAFAQNWLDYMDMPAHQAITDNLKVWDCHCEDVSCTGHGVWRWPIDRYSSNPHTFEELGFTAD